MNVGVITNVIDLLIDYRFYNLLQYLTMTPCERVMIMESP